MFFAPALLWIGTTLLLVAPARPDLRLGARRRAAAGAPGRRGFLARQRLAARRGDQPWPGLRRPAARLRRQPRRLRRHLQPAGGGRRAADARRRRRRDGAARRDRAERGLAQRIEGCRASPRPRRSTTPTPTSGPTCRTPTGSTRRRSARRHAARLLLPRRRRRDDDPPARRTATESRLRETITDYSLKSATCCGCGCSITHRQVPRRSVPRRRHGPGVPVGARDSFMVANLSYLREADHAAGAERRVRQGLGDPGRRRRRGSPPRPGRRRRRQGHRRPGGPDQQLDHHRRPDRHQPDRGGLRDLAGGGGDGVVRRPRDRGAAARVRDDGRARRLACARSERSLERGARVLGAGMVAGRARLAAVADAGGDASARLRPAAGLARDPWGFLGLLARRAVGGAVLASVLAAISLRRLPLGQTLRED